MKRIIYLSVIAMLSCLNITFANYLNMEGECTSSDTTLHYDNFAFVAAGEDTKQFTYMIPFYCNQDPIMAIENEKKLFQPFSHIMYNATPHDLGNCSIKLIWDDVRFQDSTNRFLAEIVGNKNTIAFMYGSMRTAESGAGFKISYAYMVNMDSSAPFASGYTEQELDYVEVYDYGSSYLYEIVDTDRNNELVGFKYYSPNTSQEYLKFVVPNN